MNSSPKGPTRRQGKRRHKISGKRTNLCILRLPLFSFTNSPPLHFLRFNSRGLGIKPIQYSTPPFPVSPELLKENLPLLCNNCQYAHNAMSAHTNTNSCAMPSQSRDLPCTFCLLIQQPQGVSRKDKKRGKSSKCGKKHRTGIVP